MTTSRLCPRTTPRHQTPKETTLETAVRTDYPVCELHVDADEMDRLRLESATLRGLRGMEDETALPHEARCGRRFRYLAHESKPVRRKRLRMEVRTA